MNEVVAADGGERPFYTIKSLAKRLTISDRKMRYMLKEGVIPTQPVEGMVRIDPADVDSYLAAQRERENEG